MNVIRVNGSYTVFTADGKSFPVAAAANVLLSPLFTPSEERAAVAEMDAWCREHSTGKFAQQIVTRGGPQHDVRFWFEVDNDCIHFELVWG